MFSTVNGLPVHVLVVHLVVVLVPAAAVLTIAQAWSPVVRRWAGPLAPLIALGALVVVPVATQAGEWLQERLRPTPLIDRHAELGDQLLPFVAATFACSLAAWWLGRRADAVANGDASASVPGGDRLRVLVSVLATLVALASIVQVYRIGDSGAKAVWTGTVASAP